MGPGLEFFTDVLLLAEEPIPDNYPPDVVMAPDGTFTVVYMGRNGPGVDVMARRFGIDGAPLGPSFAVNEYAPGGQSLWGVASDSEGNFSVAWEQGTDSEGRGSEIYARVFFADGTPRGPSFHANPAPYDDAFTDAYPSIAIADSGQVAVAWESWYVGGEPKYGARGARFELGCFADETSLCLGGRFHVEARWRTFDGLAGSARARPLAGESGAFWFFGPDNAELLVKVLDGCAVNDRYWVYAAGLTDVEVELEITDAWTGTVWRHANPLLKPFLPVHDVQAFATCGAAPFGVPPELPLALPVAGASESEALGCEPDATRLCLNGGRFRVAASYATAIGLAGAATALPFTDESGLFWFFSPENLELLVKVLDACEPFERYWVFAGGLTDVGVRLEVEDLATGALRVYESPLGVPFAPLQDAAAFDSCP